MRAPVLTLCLAAGLPAWAQEAQPPGIPPPLALPRAGSPAVVDGDLDDAAWSQAAVIDSFFETVFGDNRVPVVRTVALVMYDDRYLYVGLRCDDPEPARIRAPYADRDNVIGTDDNVAIFLDTRGDRRSAREFRVSPRGIQGDAVFNDANGNEDFSPDFYYDSAARITGSGWTAELRIPLSSLRYPKGEAQNWGIIVWRNYPRERRYAIYSSPQPRGANCLICLSRQLTGVSGLPAASHLVAAPYASAQDVARASAPGKALRDEATEKSAGLDVKWNPDADTSVDLTLKPDFSQVEADVAQIAVNNRFALFFPEKRPFFLEGVDLFDTPIQAAYTRTITSPRWGGRATGKLGASSYTVLVAQDRGGGSVTLPGATSSDLAPQDFESLVAVGRWRRDLGQSFVGAIVTSRDLDGGGHNRVFGPDFQWRPSQRETVSAQLLFSDTRTPARPDLAEEWDGRRLTSHGLQARWDHSTQGLGWTLRYYDFGDAFRADVGFVPQVGYRQGLANVGYSFFPGGFFSFVRPFLVADASHDRAGRLVNRRVFPGVFFSGRRNLQGELDLIVARARTGDQVLPRNQLAYSVQVDPSRRVRRVSLDGVLGQEIDVANARSGRGGALNVTAAFQPADHLSLELRSSVSWLNVEDAAAASRRLFTARVQRAKATYNFSSRAFLRLIGQYVSARREAALYGFPVPERDARLSASGLFGYRLNWQTALFLGYGDDRERVAGERPEEERLVRTGRQVFVKLSYAFQR